MNEYLIAEFLNSIDSIVTKPIQLKQRIKYTTFDVSKHCLIFGASSGGLYIFRRHPCSFVKLIPSTEGSVAHLSISPDERNIAVATSRGSVCLVSNNETISVDTQVYNEHLGNVVTAMKWNNDSNELYTGDNTGRISVVVVRNFISKTIFQTPCATLMQLDSRIVQLDWTSRFLLVSTLSRCYLCDTETEHYRQIGKKLREGEYGACFFGTPVSYTISSERRFDLNGFRILSDTESFVTYNGLEDIKIFCARPGSRLWEVQLDGTVVRTHQFKQALAQGPSNIVAFTDELDCRLNNKINTNNSTNTHSFNFIQMHIINNKFILTYQRNGLYIFDPQNASVVLWTDVYADIVDIKIVDKFIYLWTSKREIYVLLFSTIEDLVTKCLLNKKYLLCADLSISYQKHIKKLLPSSKKLYLLSNLTDKLQEQGAFELSEKFEPVSNMIKEISCSKQNAQKLTSGIFVVDNGHISNNSLLETENTFAAMTLNANQNLHDSKKIQPFEEQQFEINSENNPIQTAVIEEFEETVDIIKDESNKYKLMFEEYELNKVNVRYRTNLFEEIFSNYSHINEIVTEFLEFEKYALRIISEIQDIQIWCYEKCLEYIELHNKLEYGPYDSIFDSYMQKAYANINLSSEYSCKCGFPYPNSSLNRPKFYETGRNIIERYYMNNSNSDLTLCYNVPYLWKHIIYLRKDENVDNLLSLIVQYGDINILNEFIHKFTYDSWNDLIKKFIMLKTGNCLKCEEQFNSVTDFAMSWTALANQMILSIGAESAVYLLLQHSDSIPGNELNVDFYQSSIFTTIIDNIDRKFRSKALDFVNTINKTQYAVQFGKLLEKTLQNPQISDTSILNSENGVCNACSGK
ncbi:pink [Carabus blaptoides fortunei]